MDGRAQQGLGSPFTWMGGSVGFAVSGFGLAWMGLLGWGLGWHIRGGGGGGGG